LPHRSPNALDRRRSSDSCIRFVPLPGRRLVSDPAATRSELLVRRAHAEYRRGSSSTRTRNGRLRSRGCAPRRELLDSARVDRDHSENRFPQLLATVLEAHDGFVEALAGASTCLLGIATRSQVTVAAGCRPDMEIVALDPAGAAVARIWSEHKVGVGFRDRPRGLPGCTRSHPGSRSPPRDRQGRLPCRGGSRHKVAASANQPLPVSAGCWLLAAIKRMAGASPNELADAIGVNSTQVWDGPLAGNQGPNQEERPRLRGRRLTDRQALPPGDTVAAGRRAPRNAGCCLTGATGVEPAKETRSRFEGSPTPSNPVSSFRSFAFMKTDGYPFDLARRAWQGASEACHVRPQAAIFAWIESTRARPPPLYAGTTPPSIPNSQRSTDTRVHSVSGHRP
jgi:hypothetical protein